jgi:Domain of unknown function (DUF4932)
MKKYLICFAILMVSMIQTISSQKLTANVHPGMEVMSIVQVFAGKLAMPNKSNYAKDVENYFMPFANHPAIKKIQSFEGNVYSDLTELGWVFSFPDFTFQAPTDTSLNWYRLYGKENVVEYLTLVAQFAKDSRFMEFYQKHENVYAQWGKQMKTEIEKQGLQEKLAAFYGFNTEGGAFYICLDPLNSWGAHAVANIENINPKHAETKIYAVGYHNRESTDTTEPKFFANDFSVDLIWHEGSHIYLNNLMKKYKKEIDALGYLYNKEDEGMKRQNISNWNYCLNENMVRGVVIALFQQHKSKKEAKKQVAKEILGDFMYAEDIGGFITSEYVNTKKYKDFNALFPQILMMLKNKYPKATH